MGDDFGNQRRARYGRQETSRHCVRPTRVWPQRAATRDGLDSFRASGSHPQGLASAWRPRSRCWSAIHGEDCSRSPMHLTIPPIRVPFCCCPGLFPKRSPRRGDGEVGRDADTRRRFAPDGFAFTGMAHRASRPENGVRAVERRRTLQTGVPFFSMALRPSQIRATVGDAALMVSGAARLTGRYEELAMPVAIMAGRGDRIVDIGPQPERLGRTCPAECTPDR